MLETNLPKKVPGGIGFDIRLIFKDKQVARYNDAFMCHSDELGIVLDELYKLEPNVVNHWIERVQSNQNEQNYVQGSGVDPF